MLSEDLLYMGEGALQLLIVFKALKTEPPFLLILTRVDSEVCNEGA